MTKKCKQCDQPFTTPYINRKEFCNSTCQQEWWRKARNITGRFDRRDQYKLAEEIRKNHLLTPKQFQLCYGTILGDACIQPRPNGSCRMAIAHTITQLDYLMYKSNILKPLIIQPKPTLEPPANYMPNPTYRITTIVHPQFSELYGLFYHQVRGKRIKTITRKILNLLNPYSILIWYLDDGCLTKDKAYRFATNCFSLGEHRAIKRWLWKRFRIRSTIYHNTNKNSYFLGLNVSSSKILHSLWSEFLPEIPKSMNYKLLS